MLTGELTEGGRFSAPNDADRLVHRRVRATVNDGACADICVAAIADIDATKLRIEYLAAEDQDLARIDYFDGTPLVGSACATTVHDEAVQAVV